MEEKYYTTPNGTIVGESTLRSKYGDRFDSFLSDGKITEVSETIYETPNGSLVQESVLKDKYGERFNTFLSDGKLKKKEQTEPTQAAQTQQAAPTQAAPLPGLGGVSEEPTPSPSVGQGVLRDVDQTQPTGEEFIAGVSDLTRTDVREPQQDDVSQEDMLSNIYSKFPALRKLGDVTLKADTNFTRENTGVGDIEFFDKEDPFVDYPGGYSAKHPKLGTYGILYNPKANDEQTIALDMLHGMPSADPKYKQLREDFGEAYMESKFSGDFKASVENLKKEVGENQFNEWYPNGEKDYFDKSYIDGIIRNLLFQGSDEDFKRARYWDKAREIYLSDDNISDKWFKIEDYLTEGKGLHGLIAAKPYENVQKGGAVGVMGPTGPTGATGTDGQVDVVPEIDYGTMGIGETPTGAPISMDDPYIRKQDELRRQADENKYQFGIDEPDEFLPNYTALGLPENVKDSDVKDYLSDQIGEVQRIVNQVMSNPEEYGFPKRILSATEEDIQELTNQIYRQSAPASTYNRGRGGLIPLPIESQSENFINLDESYFRNVVKNAVNNYKSRYEVDKNDRILKEITSDYIQAGYEKEKIRGVIFGELSNQEKFDDEEKKLYDINNQLRTLRGQLSSLTPDSPKYSEVQQKYNSLILGADDARKKLGDDREALYDTRTGERVDKIDSPNTSNLTLQIQDEMEQLTFEEDVQDVYIKAGLADNEHKSYGQKTKFDIEIPLTRTGKTDMLMHRQAIDGLKMLGYQSSPVLDEDGNQTNRMSFKDVSLSDISNSYVREAVRRTNESLAENAERWHDRNVDLMVKRIAARNMSLLNIDPGKIKKEQFSALGIDFYPARMLEVIGEEVLPKGMTEEIGISDVKLVDNAIPQLEAHGIELTESQKENAKRGIDLEVQEGVASFVPVIGELAFLNKGAGVLKTVTGLGKIVETLRTGSKLERGTAIAIEALIEEGQMQIADMNTGAGASFSVMGNRLRKYGLDKFPLRFKGELARLNKFGDNVWSNSMTGVVTMEFASNVEAAIEDFMGGETMQNHIEQNYSDLSEVGKRGLVNALVFNIIGARGLIGKGQGGFRIRKMEEARDEMRSKGYTQEADRLDSYIKEYYAGKKTSWEVQLTPEEKSAIRNRMARAGETGDVEIQEWFSKNPKEGKKVLKKGVVSVGTFDKIKSLFGIRPEIIRDLSESKVEKVGENYEVKLLTDGKEVASYKTESKEEAEVVSNEINTDLKERESVGETAPTVTEPTGDIVPAKQKGRLTKFSTPQNGIVGEVTYEDGTKKELTQEEYDALEKQEGLFDVETGTQPVAETAPKELSPKQKEAYNRLTKEEKDAVDELIFDEQYELSIGAKDVEKPKGLTKEESAIWDYENKIAKESIAYEDALNNALGVVAEKQKADGEVFTFGQDKYNIDKAVNLANTEGIEPVEIGIETLPKMQMPFVLKTEKGIRDADLSKPVIVATTKDGMMLIDGHHRLEKAIREGKPVKAQILSESQTLEIKETVPTEAVAEEAAPTETPSEVATEKVEEVPEQEAVKPTEEVAEETVPTEKIEKELADDKFELSDDNRLNEGGTRFVQEVDGGIIKVAEDDAGIIQNKQEGVESWTPQVIERGYDYVIVEKVNTKENKVLSKFFKDLDALKFNDFKPGSEKIKTLSEKYNLTNLDNYIEDVMYGDFVAHEQWGEKNGQIMLVDAGSLVAKPSEAQKGKTQQLDNIESLEISKNEKRDAIQEQAAGEVPVQPETKAGEKMEEGKPEAEPKVAAEKGKEEVLSEEDAKSEEKVNKKIEEDSGEKDLVKEVVKSTVTKEEKKKVAEEEGIDDSEVESKIEEEVRNQINDKTEKEPKTLLQRIASRIRKAIMSLLIVANALNISGVKAPTAKSKAYDNIKVENLQSFDKMYMDQEAVNKKNNIDIIRKSQANKNENYIIVDKATGSAHLFKGEELITSYQVGVGEKSGDIQTRVKSIYLNDKTGKEVPISVATTEKNGVKYLKPGFSSRTNWNDGTKTTGAGIFKIAEKTSYIGERAFSLLNEQGISTEMMLHEVTTPVRAKLMSDGNPDNNRITNGCINFMYEDTKDLEKRGVGAGAMVYVLPDNPNNAYKIVDGELRFESEDPKVNRTTAYTKPFQAQPITIKAKGQIPQQAKEFLVTVADVKSEIMEMYPTISNDEYNRMAKIAYGIFGQESSFGTYGGPRGKVGFIKDIGQVALEKVGVDEVNVFGKLFKASDPSVGLTQTRLSSIPENVRKKFGINESKDLLNNEKSAIATMAAMVNMYVNEIEPTGMGGEMENIIPLGWSNDRTSSSPFVKALKGDESQYKNKYVENVRNASNQLEVYIGDNPIEKPTEKKDSTEGEAPIGLMALPLLFGGTIRRRKPLEDTDSDKVVTEWMEDVQKIYDAQKTKNKREARDQAAVNLALSGKLDNLAPDQVKAVLEGIQTETDAMGKKWSVSTLSELDGLTIKQQFKQGFEEYVAAMKQKEADKIKKAKDSAQKKIDAAKERTAKVIEKIKDDKEARKLFEAIVNDLAKDSGLSQISRNKASELLKSSRDVNAQNLERLIQKAVRVIQYEYTRNIVKESDKKISDFKKNIEKNKFGTLTQTAKELAQITTQDIPIGLLPRFVDVIDGVSKKSPSAKDLEELAKFMSEFKNELDQQITDIQYFADVLNDFKSQEETEKIDDYLKENGFTEAQIDFFNKNRKAINSAYKSFYTKDGKELTAQEKIQKISEQILDAKKVFREMKKNGEAKVDLKKFKGRVQREVDIAEFFNNIEESDIDYLTRSEANKLPVVFDNLNRGMVTNAEKKIMNRIKGERDLDAFEKEDPKSPIKRAKTKDGMFKSFVSNAAEFSKLERSFDPSVLKSSKELKEDIEKKVLDYVDEAIKGLKGKPLYNQISKVIRPLVGANTKIARLHEKANELFEKMDGSPLHNTTLMSVYFRSREFDLNPNNPKIKNPLEYIEKTLENTNLSEKKRAVLKGIRNEYFRNGKPLTNDMLSFIKKSKGGPLIEFMDEVMAARKEDVRFMSEVDESNPAEFFNGYQPRSTMESGSKSIEDLLSDVSNSVGRPSLRSSAVQSRKSTVNALTFDAMDDFMRTVASIEMQKSVAPALSEVNAFISAAKRSGNEDARIFAETLRGVLDSYVKNTLARDYKQKGLYGNIWSSMGRKIKKNTLAGMSKATVESLIQLGKIHIDEDANNAFYKNASMERNVSNQQILTALNSMNVARAGVLSSEMSRKRSFITDAVRRGDAGKAEELIYHASKTIPGRVVSGIDDFVGDVNTALIKFPDLVGTVQIVIGGAAIRFKEITGKELDLDKVVNDPEYRAKYKDELEASIAYGDQLGTRMGGPGAMEQKSLQDIMGGDIRDLNRFVRSFSTNENEQILSALTTLGVPTSNALMGRRERGAEFENKRKAARGLASSLFGLGGYTSLRMALGTLILGLFGAILNGDDWEEEFDYWDWDVFKARVLGDTVWTALFGKLGIVESLIGQTLIAYGVRQAYKEAGEEEKGEKIADGMFFSTIDQNDRATKTFKMLGPEGKLAGSILETMYIASDAYEDQNFDLLSDPRFKNNLFTISKGALNLPAAQDVGIGVRKAWYGRDENRKVRESFGDSGDSNVIGTPQKEVLRLYKETRDRFVLPSVIKDKPRKIRKKGVSFDVFISPFSVNELQKLKGKFIAREMNKIMSTREYINTNDSGKIELLKKIYKEWNNSSSIKSISKGKYESIDDFYEKNTFIKPRRSK